MIFKMLDDLKIMSSWWYPSKGRKVRVVLVIPARRERWESRLLSKKEANGESRTCYHSRARKVRVAFVALVIGGERWESRLLSQQRAKGESRACYPSKVREVRVALVIPGRGQRGASRFLSLKGGGLATLAVFAELHWLGSSAGD